MNLNNISLPPQLIADFYQHALVSDTETALPQTPPVTALGKGGKGILIFVNKPDVPYLPDNELEFLTKVLSACQLGLADVAIINWNKATHQDTAAIMEQFGAKEVILFDVDPVYFHLPAGLPVYSVYPFQKRQFVAAPALQQIEESKESKGQLWTVLKKLFCL